MKYPRVVSIDLGSAYTKIAFRDGWNAQSVLMHDLPLATKELTFCVPSVVVKVTRGTQEKWLIGAAAASQLPGEGITIYRNWKASLFREGPVAANAQTGSDLSETESVQVAIEFFSSLRAAIGERRLERDLSTLPVRICIPKFGNFVVAEQRVGEILRQAGWTPAEQRLAMAEPEANALGIMSRGSNKTWLPKPMDFQPLPGRCPNLPAMLQAPGLLQALHSMTGYYGVLVIDIGAFTTDFGFVRFDASFADDSLNRPAITQQSYPVGIRNLDRAVFSRLSTEVQHAIREHASTADWESLKPALYKGEEVAIRNPRGGVLYLGKNREGKMVKDTVIAFAERIWELRSRFCEAMVNGQIHAQTLTGGGSMIPTVRNTLTSRVKVANGIPVRDLLDDPALRRRSAAPPSQTEIEAHARQTRELVRGGSAIGGASVFFESLET